MIYKASCLQDIARLFEAKARSEREARQRLAHPHGWLASFYLERANTWDYAAQILRDTTLVPAGPSESTRVEERATPPQEHRNT